MPSARRRFHRVPISWNRDTPWGAPDQALQYDNGIVFVSTSSHGGFHLDEEHNAIIPESMRNASGWYEEDIDSAIVIFHFPKLFSSAERECAKKTLIHWRPAIYEKLTGIQLTAADSLKVAEDEFLRRHASDMIVVSARLDPADRNYVICHASQGRNRKLTPKAFRIPAAEYRQNASFGFVIDPARHKSID